MSMRILTSIGVTFHVLLGGFCMMPMASAASLPVQHDEAMEMNMTPMFPMSPAHCGHCMHVDKQNSTPMHNGCAGHCLAIAHDTVAAVVSVSSVDPPSVALASAFPATDDPVHVIGRITLSTAPPINFALARNIVLIQ